MSEKKRGVPWTKRMFDIGTGGVIALFLFSFVGMIVRILTGTISKDLLVFLAGQGTFVVIAFIPVVISKFNKWLKWRRRIIKDDRPPTPQEIHEAFLDALERLTGRRPNTSEIMFPGIPSEFLPKFNPGPPQGSA